MEGLSNSGKEKGWLGIRGLRPSFGVSLLTIQSLKIAFFQSWWISLSIMVWRAVKLLEMSFLVLVIFLSIFVLFDERASLTALCEAEIYRSWEGTKELQKDFRVSKVEPIVGTITNWTLCWGIVGADESKVGLTKHLLVPKREDKFT